MALSTLVPLVFSQAPELPQVMAWTYVGNDDSLGPVGTEKAHAGDDGWTWPRRFPEMAMPQ